MNIPDLEADGEKSVKTVTRRSCLVCVVGQKKRQTQDAPPPPRSTVRFVSRHTELREGVVSGCLDAPASPASTCTTFTPPLPSLFSAPTTRGRVTPKSHRRTFGPSDGGAESARSAGTPFRYVHQLVGSGYSLTLKNEKIGDMCRR